MNLSQILHTCDGFKISAVHTVSERHNVVLWLHGITVDKNEYLNFFKDGADYILNQGIDSLRIDFRGHGDSNGTSKDFDIIGQIIDTKTALKYIKNYYSNIDPNIYIVGCSFGAPPAIYTAIEYSSLIKGVVLISPVLSYRRTFLEPETEWAQSIFNNKTLSEVETTNQLFFDESFSVNLKLIEEMKLIKPEEDIKNLSQNTIIIHGDADSMVPFDISEEVSNNKSNIKFYSMAGMDHGFMDKNDEEGTGSKSIKNKSFIYKIISELCS